MSTTPEKGVIPKIKGRDFLIHQEQPERTDPNYVPFWQQHISYCRSGVMVGGVYFSGWLYWHINFFKVMLDVKDEWGNKDRAMGDPSLRDNEWYINWGIDLARDNNKPLMFFGSRRIAKSVILTSRMSYTVFIKKNSHTLIVGADSGDLGNITKYFEEFYEKRPDCFSDIRKFGVWKDLNLSFNKKEVLKMDPVTKKKGVINPMTQHLLDITSENTTIYSTVSVKNLEHGKKLSKKELLAGATPSEVIFDEVGKLAYNEQYRALKPALMTTEGELRSTILFAGTGGSVELSKDAEADFLNAETKGFLHVDVEEYKKEVKAKYFKYTQVSTAQTGLFPPAEMSNAGGRKIEMPLSEYLNRDFTAKEIKELEGLTIHVTDWEKARTRVLKQIEIDEASSDADGKKAKMYYPFQPEDCFLNTKSSNYPIEAAKLALKNIKESKNFGELVDLSQDSKGEIILTPSNKKLVDKFPYQGGAHDAPVAIYERPISEIPKNIKYGTYVGGFDGYKIATSNTTDSVGSFYIYKRKSGVTGSQNQIVASIAARPTQENIFYRQVLLLIKLYNAEVLPESDVPFWKYMDMQKSTYLLANCKNLAEGIVKGKSNANITYGLPATGPNKEYYLKKIQAYCWEPFVIGYEEDGTPINLEGVHRIPDPMLLEEIIHLNDTGNFDRVAAFGHALAWAAEMDAMKVVGGPEDNEKKSFNINNMLNKIKKQDGRM